MKLGNVSSMPAGPRELTFNNLHDPVELNLHIKTRRGGAGSNVMGFVSRINLPHGGRAKGKVCREALWLAKLPDKHGAR